MDAKLFHELLDGFDLVMTNHTIRTYGEPTVEDAVIEIEIFGESTEDITNFLVALKIYDWEPDSVSYNGNYYEIKIRKYGKDIF